MVLESAACCNIYMDGGVLDVCIVLILKDMNESSAWRGQYFCIGCVALLLLFNAKVLEIYKRDICTMSDIDDFESYIHHYSYNMTEVEIEIEMEK